MKVLTRSVLSAKQSLFRQTVWGRQAGCRHSLTEGLVAEKAFDRFEEGEQAHWEGERAHWEGDASWTGG